MVFTVPADGDYRITEVNFFADLSGTLTPFVARYLGVSTQLGSSYEILAKGDPLTVTSADNTFGPSPGDHLENRLFTSGGSHPVISVLAGQQLVAGWFQSGNIVYIGGGGTQGAADYVYGGNSIAGPVGSALSANSGFAFDRTMQFNIGMDPIVLVPEPSRMLLLVTGLAFAVFRRRRSSCQR